MRATLLMLVLALTGCGKSDEQREKEDARDVAMVKAVQNRLPPIELVVLQSLLPADRGRIDAVGGRCSYALAKPEATDPVAVTVGSFGWIKITDELLKLAADTGSEAGPAQTWTHYTGREISLRFLPGEASGAQANSAAMRRSIRMVVRDSWDRVILTENLVQACRS